MGPIASKGIVRTTAFNLECHLLSLQEVVSVGGPEAWLGRIPRSHKGELDLSSVALDGSHTPAIRGGAEVEYQGRKSRKTTHALYLTDRQGLPLAMSEPTSGDHSDLHGIEVQFEVVKATLEEASTCMLDRFF